LASRNGGQVADRIAQRHSFSLRFGPRDATAVQQADEDEPRSVLRDAVVEAVKDASVDVVPEIAKRFEEGAEHRAVIPRRKIGNVLDKNRSRTKAFDDCDE